MNRCGYRRDHLRALAHRVEVDQKELRIMGSNSVLLVHWSPLQAQNGWFWRAQFCTEVAAPRPTKMGNIVSPWRYDPIAGDAPQSVSLRCAAMRPVRFWESNIGARAHDPGGRRPGRTANFVTGNSFSLGLVFLAWLTLLMPLKS